jgi:hypothetical protein
MSFADIAKELLNSGIPVSAKLTVGERSHRTSVPNDLNRRKANQLELLSYLEKRPVKMPPKATDDFKSVFGNPADKFTLDTLDSFLGIMKKFGHDDANIKLKDVPEIAEIAKVKDEIINVRQFNVILKAAVAEKAGRIKALQNVLRIDDDDLSIKNVKKYLTNVDREISEKSNYWDVADREIEDELDLPKITHKDLAFTKEEIEPQNVFDLVREFQERANIKKFDLALKKLFPTLKYDILITLDHPASTGPEVGAIRENIISIMDSLTGHTWENNYSLVMLRSTHETCLVGFHANEHAIMRDTLPRYRKILIKMRNVWSVRNNFDAEFDLDED